MHEEGAAPSGGDEVDSVGMLCDDMQTECEGASPRRTSSVSAFGKKPQIEVLHVPDTLSAMWRDCPRRSTMESCQEGGGAHCFVLHFGALELTFNFYDDAPRAQ